MIGEALRMIRVFHDLSQRDLAIKLQIAPSYLSEIESGKKQPTLQLVENYSEYFKIPVSSIMFFSEKINSKSRSGKIKMNISEKVLSLLNFIAARSEKEAQ